MLTLQIYLDGCWHDAAVLDFKEPYKGRDGEALLAYDFNYAVEHLDRNDLVSCSINYPVMLIGSHFAKPWFGFLDDIIPAGASRRYWIAQQLNDLVSESVLLQELSVLANKLKGLKARLETRGVPASILEMPGIGFNHLDERIAGWKL